MDRNRSSTRHVLGFRVSGFRGPVSLSCFAYASINSLNINHLVFVTFWGFRTRSSIFHSFEISLIRSINCIFFFLGFRGDPLFLEPFWKQHAESSAVVVAGWHRMSYSFSDDTTLSKELESLLRKLHSQVGNAVTDGKYILFGAGSTQLLNAAVHALSSHNSSLPASVVASIPYYAVSILPLMSFPWTLRFILLHPYAQFRCNFTFRVWCFSSSSSQLYQMQIEFFDSADCSFQGDTARWKNATNTTGDIIEFVTAPNNPDGLLNEAVLHGPNVKTIYDRAYYWPHFTGIPSPADEDLIIFTISKLTGHAGSRFG